MEVGCAYTLAYKALRYMGDGDKARQVRELALVRGGKKRIDAPEECAILQEEQEEHKWTLLLRNGISVRMDFSGGSVSLYQGERKVAVYPDVEVRQVGSIIAHAANL